MRIVSGTWPVFVVAVLALGARPAAAQECAPLKTMTFRVESEIQRDVRGFTQGLEVHGDKLFESTGAIAGDTRLTTIDAKGHVTVLADFAKSFFGEGLTILKDRLYQLSWREGLVSVYDLNGKRLRQMKNPREGWGLTNDGTNLIFTDGSSQLFYADPATFNILRTVQVHIGRQPLDALNELENVDGKIYSNVFTTWNIVRIEPKTGCVEALADLRPLWDRMSAAERQYVSSDSNFVLNGIAYDGGKKLFYVTGKNWKIIFTGHFADAN